MHMTDIGKGAHRGFTLIEILAAVAVVAILASIAMPAYSDYTRKAKIQEAFTVLLALDTKEQLYWNDAHNYGPSDCAVGATAGSTKYFTYLCGINNSQQGYVLTAAGQGDLLGYKFELVRDSTGVKKRTVDFLGASGFPLPCWISSPGPC